MNDDEEVQEREKAWKNFYHSYVVQFVIGACLFWLECGYFSRFSIS